MTDSDVDELVDMRQAGEQIDVLAARFGVGRNTVMAHLKRRDVPGHRWRGRTLSSEDLEAAGRLYESGINLIAVGEKFAVDRRYLRKALPEAGFPIRPGGQQKRQASS